MSETDQYGHAITVRVGDDWFDMDDFLKGFLQKHEGMNVQRVWFGGELVYDKTKIVAQKK